MKREFEGSKGTRRQVAMNKEIKCYKEWEEKRKDLVCHLGSVGLITTLDLVHTLTA